MKKIKGDLLNMFDDGAFDVIIHGANCFNTMGGGIARQIRDRYPAAWSADQVTEAGDATKLGDYTCAEVVKSKSAVIVNAYTQYDYNRGGETLDRFEYDSFRLVLSRLLMDFGGVDYGLPEIGMGLAGGDRQKIMAIIEEFSERVECMGGTVTLVEWKP